MRSKYLPTLKCSGIVSKLVFNPPIRLHIEFMDTLGYGANQTAEILNGLESHNFE